MYESADRLVIFDADGTLIDAFPAVELAFVRHGMDIGDLHRFQRRRKLLKYLGGLREFPRNLRRQLDKDNRQGIKNTLTEVYREQATLFPGIAEMLSILIEQPGVRVGIVSRNVTVDPEHTLRQLFARHGIDCAGMDFLQCIPLGETKAPSFRAIRERLGINPGRAHVCGDEHRDYSAAVEAGMHPLVVSYGFEDHRRLREAYGIPEEVLVRTPAELVQRLFHTLQLPADSTAGDPLQTCPRSIPELSFPDGSFTIDA